MNVDLYRRAERDNKFTYLAVPAGEMIPEEATNVDWELRKKSVHVDEMRPHLEPYHIDDAGKQIAEKGYAITSVMHQVDQADAKE